MQKYVKKCLSNCLECLQYDYQPRQNIGFLHNIDKEDQPWSTLHIDHLEPLEKTENGYKHIFLLVDAFTKFAILKPTKTTKTSKVIKILTSLFKIFGTPKRIISDRGTCFTSEEFQKYCGEYETMHVKVAVQTPRANGQVERYNRTVIPMLL